VERAPLLRDQVVAGVLRELQDGRFSPGERLTEEHIATVLGVSGNPSERPWEYWRKEEFYRADTAAVSPYRSRV
jgi:hypothetical protein